jgi:predicted anti-sigma-YlaC factor YlaD
MVSRIARIFRRNGEIEHVYARGMASDYIDDELESGTREKIRAHLEQCGPCHSFFNTLRATTRLLRTSESHDPPPSFDERLRAKLRDADGR